MLAVSGERHQCGAVLAGGGEVAVIERLLFLRGAVAADDDDILMTGRLVEVIQHSAQRLQRRLAQADICTADVVVFFLIGFLVFIDASDLGFVGRHIGVVIVDQNQIALVHSLLFHCHIFIDCGIGGCLRAAVVRFIGITAGNDTASLCDGHHGIIDAVYLISGKCHQKQGYHNFRRNLCAVSAGMAGLRCAVGFLSSRLLLLFLFLTHAFPSYG